MKRKAKTLFKAFGIIAFLCCFGFFCIYILPVIKMFHSWRQQMLAGQKYMDSLTENDFKTWATRTKEYLTHFNPTNWVVEGKAIPSDLKELKIVSVYYENSNSVDYVWMGGFDHTMLNVERLANGQFKFTAVYNDASNRVIWPNPVVSKDSQTP